MSTLEFILLIIALCLAIELILIKRKNNEWDLAETLGGFTGVLIGVAFRVLSFPLACLIILIVSLRQWLALSLDYLLTGGEFVIYKNIAHKNTILDYLNELTKNK